MRRPLVAGNWKMNGTRASVAELVSGLHKQSLPEQVDVVVFPGFLHADQVLTSIRSLDLSVGVGVQDCSPDPDCGARTGEISAHQIADLGCAWVLVGHSERRTFWSESDEVLTQKCRAAQQAGLKIVFCVGETLEQRESGISLAVVEQQLKAVLPLLDAHETVVIAYEPIWAIGTGLTAQPNQVQEIHAGIRAWLARCLGAGSATVKNMRILYGGSVKAANACELFAMPDVDGGLIGGASLSADEFGAICRAAGN